MGYIVLAAAGVLVAALISVVALALTFVTILVVNLFEDNDDK